MPRRLLVLLASTALVAAAPGLERPASAITCAAEPGAPGAYESHRLVFEGIALSGELDVFGGLDSPARVLVTRWIKGRGPRIVRVETATDVGTGQFTLHLPGYYTAHPGEIVRLFVNRVRGGVLVPTPPECDGDRRRPPRSPLRAVGGSAVTGSAGGYAWRAHAERGPLGLRCVALHPVGRHTAGGRECSLGGPLLAVHGELPGDASTAITVAGRDIADVELRTPDGPVRLRPRGPGHPVLAVLPGRVHRSEVRARITTSTGAVRWLRPVGFPTVLADDPGLGRPWEAAVEPLGRRACVGVDQLVPRHGPLEDDPLTVEDGEKCDDLRRRGSFFAIRTASRADRRPERTVVFGVARAGSTVTVTDHPGGGVRLLALGAGGQFLTVYPASVRAADLEVEVTPPGR